MRQGGAATNKVKAMKTVLLFRKIDSLIFAAAFSLAATYSVKSDSCSGVGISGPDVVVVENEPFARIRLYRSSAIGLVQKVYYFTSGGNPGVDYVPSSGTATFAVGEEATNVDIPLIDNGLLDGIRDFGLVLTNRSPGLLAGPDSLWVRIEDNELRSTVDPLFVPDVPIVFNPLAMPDGRIVMAGMTMLQSNGWVDINFAKRFALSFSGGWVSPLQVLSDGRIIGYGWSGSEPQRRIVIFLPDGSFESELMIPDLSEFVAAQSDLKLLVLTTNNNVRTLRRFDLGGTFDTNFNAWKLLEADCQFGFIVQPDQKIVVGKPWCGKTKLIRLNPDGSPDNTFSPPPFESLNSGLLLRTHGKIIASAEIVAGAGDLIQLNDNGTIDGRLRLSPHPNWGVFLPEIEQSDGRLLAGVAGLQSTILRWNADGTLDANFAPDIVGGWAQCSSEVYMHLLKADRLFVAGSTIRSVDGFPRRGLARLLSNPPGRDFRVLTPAEFFRSRGVARIRVLRTGPTTNAASVSFITSDDTAKAGDDYVSQSGTLNFSPLEVSKEVMVPLLARTGVDARLSFKLELSNPSAGYTTIVSTPIAILSDLRIATDSLRPRGDGSIAITLRGTVPGRWYSLESSSDLKDWQWIAGIQAVGNSVLFDNLPRQPSTQFFRASPQ